MVVLAFPPDKLLESSSVANLKLCIQFSNTQILFTDKNSPFQQVSKLQTCCGRLCRKFYGCDFIIDDESFSHSDFTFSHSDKNSNVGYWSSNPKAVSCGVKYKSKAKFEKKMLVWLTVSSRGISTPYFVPSGLAVKQNVYLKECIIKRLMPFI